MQRLLQRVLLALLAVWLSACHTMAGLGRDVEKLGDKIEHKAEEKRRY